MDTDAKKNTPEEAALDAHFFDVRPMSGPFACHEDRVIRTASIVDALTRHSVVSFKVVGSGVIVQEKADSWNGVLLQRRELLALCDELRRMAESLPI